MWLADAMSNSDLNFREPTVYGVGRDPYIDKHIMTKVKENNRVLRPWYRRRAGSTLVGSSGMEV